LRFLRKQATIALVAQEDDFPAEATVHDVLCDALAAGKPRAP